MGCHNVCKGDFASQLLHMILIPVQHYNSIRNVDDLSVGTAPEPIVFRSRAEGNSAAVASNSKVGEKSSSMLNQSCL
jgi:hypothetical protein